MPKGGWWAVWHSSDANVFGATAVNIYGSTAVNRQVYWRGRSQVAGRFDPPPARNREGYTPAAPAVRPTAHLQRALGIIPSANKTHNSLLLDSLLFDTPSLCTVQHVLGDSFFFFEPPPPPAAANPCVLGLGVGVMGNAGLCSCSAHGLQVPSSFLYILVHFKGLVK